MASPTFREAPSVHLPVELDLPSLRNEPQVGYASGLTSLGDLSLCGPPRLSWSLIRADEVSFGPHSIGNLPPDGSIFLIGILFPLLPDITQD